MIEQIQAEDFEQLFEIEQQAHLVPWSKGTLLNNQVKIPEFKSGRAKQNCGFCH